MRKVAWPGVAVAEQTALRAERYRASTMRFIATCAPAVNR